MPVDLLKRPEITKRDVLEDKAWIEKQTTQIRQDADWLDDQRDKANEAMRFIYSTGGHWENFFGDFFRNRVKLQFDVTTPYKNRFIADYNDNRMGVEYKPDDDATSDNDASFLTGKRRADFVQFSGRVAQDNAVDEVAVCGFGSYLLATEWDDPGDEDNEDQHIVWRPIYDAYNAVFWDTSAQRADKRDANHCTILKQFTVESFKKEYPGKQPVSAYVPRTRRYENFNNGAFHGSDPIYIATRYEKIWAKDTVYFYRNFLTDEIKKYHEDEHQKVKDELREDPFIEFVKKRRIKTQYVEKTVFSGQDILSPTRRIIGKHIPVIQMYGYRGYVDGMEWFKGLVRDLMDPQRLLNVQISKVTENAGTSGKELPIFAPSQMAGDKIKELWTDLSNINYVIAEPLRDDKTGQIVAQGPLGYTKRQELDGNMAALIDIVLQFVQQKTGGAPMDTLDPKTSGKAIKAMLKRANQDTQPMMKNIADSIAWEGEVYMSMYEEIHSSKKRIRTIGPDGTEGVADMFEMIFDEESGTFVESNPVKGKKFKVISDVGPQYETMREQLVEELKGIVEAIKDTPAGAKYIPVLIAMILQNMSGPGMEPLKKLVRQDMIQMGLIQPETDEERQKLQQFQQASQENPDAEAMQALAKEAEAKARESDSKAQVNVAEVDRKIAQTMEILDKIEQSGFKNLIDLRNTGEQRVASLPLN